MLKEAAEQEEKRKKDEANQKKEAGKVYRNTCKEFVMFVVKMIPESKYDKFYLAEMIKKYPAQA